MIQNKTNDADLSRYIESGMIWLAENQNKDGGWGDSIRSNSNISTSTLCRAAFQLCDTDNKYPDIRKSVDSYLEQNIGSLDPGSISQAIYKCYGKDRTFAVPILTMMVLSAGACTKSDWKHIKQLKQHLQTNYNKTQNKQNQSQICVQNTHKNTKSPKTDSKLCSKHKQKTQKAQKQNM